jgi:thiol-disulfide isomerase/thioredoxin
LRDGDRVFKVNTPQFRPAGAPAGLPVAFVESHDRGFLFVDANLDGRFTESERLPYEAGSMGSDPREVAIEITMPAPGGAVLPFRCSLASEQWENETRYVLRFTAAFRVQGYVEIDGRRTLVSLPFDAGRGTVDIRRGKIAIDGDGDGRVDLSGVSGPEMMFARGERVILPVGRRYFSVESADFAARSFLLQEHPPSEYAVIDLRPGVQVPDFDFTDFEGAARKLSEFRGRYVLLDFWGSWCAPCLADLPVLKEAYDRFRSRGFEILGIDYEHSATTAAVRSLLKEKGVTWTNATPESVKDLVDKRFRVWGFPTLILLDPDSRIVEARTPMLSGPALLAMLERLLPRP